MIQSKHGNLLKVGTLINLILLLIIRVVYPELLWLTLILSVGLIAFLGALALLNQKALKGRTAAFGLNSLVTIVLVFGIIGVINFMGARYPAKLDLTENKIHTLSDQSAKVVKGLKSTVKATYFATPGAREQSRSLFDNYSALSPKFELEVVDPVREPTRVKRSGIKKDGTLILNFGEHESRLDGVTEEKLTNALIKLLKEKSPVVCAITGHAEKNFNSKEAEGFNSAREGLIQQSYQIKDVNLAQEGSVPADCDAVAILGAQKSFFSGEIAALKTYLDAGGKDVIGLDLNLSGTTDYAPELVALLETWHIKARKSLIVDPVSRLLQLDPSVAPIMTYSKDSSISREFVTNCAFPFSRPLEIIPGANPELHLEWLAQTTPKSMEVTQLKSAGQIEVDPAKAPAGPFNIAVSVEGKTKDSKATKSTRLVVFGSSHFAANNYGRVGGNMDFFLNSVSWILEDESLISIRKKESEAGKIELTAKSGNFIGLLNIIILPGLTGTLGLGVFLRRRRL